jgi:hypothetical protein
VTHRAVVGGVHLAPVVLWSIGSLPPDELDDRSPEPGTFDSGSPYAI